jgi:cyclophilin family peptidyl-prolyl cis-trans isomerase
MIVFQQRRIFSLGTISLLTYFYTQYLSWGFQPLGEFRGLNKYQYETTSCLSSNLIASSEWCSSVSDREKSTKTVPTRRIFFIQSSSLLVPLIVTGFPALVDASYIDPSIDIPIITKRVFLDVLLPGNDNPDRVIIGLFGDNLPRVVDNFVKLCDGVSVKRNDGTLLSYAGTSFYRVISDVTVQGGAIGDVTGKTGLSSMENGIPFEPDNFSIKHSREGLVSMVRGANGGVDSRFFINTSTDAGWADDRYAAFGIVEKGMDVIHRIEKVKVQRPQNSPIDAVKIMACGVISS